MTEQSPPNLEERVHDEGGELALADGEDPKFIAGMNEGTACELQFTCPAYSAGRSPTRPENDTHRAAETFDDKAKARVTEPGVGGWPQYILLSESVAKQLWLETIEELESGDTATPDKIVAARKVAEYHGWLDE